MLLNVFTAGSFIRGCANERLWIKYAVVRAILKFHFQVSKGLLIYDNESPDSNFIHYIDIRRSGDADIKVATTSARNWEETF